MAEVLSGKHVLVLTEIVDVIRCGRARTRREVEDVTGLGRAVVRDRIEEGIALGLLADGDLAQPDRGRPSRTVRFRAEAGSILVACLGVQECFVGVADLDGRVLEWRREQFSVDEGPRATLRRVDAKFRALLRRHRSAPVWGIGIGLPGPVDFRSGTVVAPPVMPGWDGFDVRGWFARRHEAPIWVDNEVNLMALGEWERGVPHDERDLLYVKVGTTVGSGLVTEGRLHRGDTGAAGDIGHVRVGHVRVGHEPAPLCRCGRTGCLEACVSGWALVRDLETAAAAGRSEFLTGVLAAEGELRPLDVGVGAQAADPVVVETVLEAARTTGRAVAGVVNFANPGTLVLGGGVLRTGDVFLEEFRATVLAETITLASGRLVVRPASLDYGEGVAGGAALVRRQLFDRGALGVWIGEGNPLNSAGRLHEAA